MIQSCRLLLLYIFLAASCSEGDIEIESVTERCPVSSEFIVNYIRDMGLVTQKEEVLSNEPINAFRRLEALTDSELDTDNLASIFHNELNNQDTLTSYITRWTDWLENNKCSVDLDYASRTFKEANERMSVPDYQSHKYLEKLRLLNGLDRSDHSKDSVLILVDSMNFANMFLRWKAVEL